MSALWVNVYEITRKYGGPEEGGWWYNTGEPIHTEGCDSLKEAVNMQKQLKKLYADHVHGDIYSTLGGAQVQVLIETAEGWPWPKTKPHYE